MCGRFKLSTPAEEIAAQLGAMELPSLRPRYNIAPTQDVLAICLVPEPAVAPVLRGKLLHWGLLPSWAKDPTIGNRLINARAETVAEKPAFRAAFRRRRCLLVADGFYEWQQTAGAAKQPMLIERVDGSVFAFAGLYERLDRGPAAPPLESCTIITTSANTLMEPIHHRMPVILDPRDYLSWLDPDQHDTPTLLAYLGPCPADLLRAFPVSSYVNCPGHDDPGCAAPLSA